MRKFHILVAVVIATTTLGGAVHADKGRTAPAAPPAQAAQPAPPAQSMQEEGTVWPIQLALVPQFQLVHEDYSIEGFRLNIYGRNQNVTGVDIGLANETKEDFKGISFGLLNIVHGEGRGLQISVLYNEGKKRMSGLQLGLVNRSGSIQGVQIGLVNFADDMTGFQFGLWNEIKNKEQWNVIPIINAAF